MLKGNQIKVAVIDDDEDDYFIIKDYILGIENGNFVIDWINDYPESINKIKEQAYHIYFVDYRLGNKTGLDLLQEVSAMQCDQPIVLLTGKGNIAIDIKAMQSGATDYLVKSDLNTEKLERCIRYSLDRADSLRELKARESKYSSLFKGSKDAVFISDKNLFFTECNQAASLFFGMDNGELLNRSLFEFMGEGQQNASLHKLLEREESITDMEIQIQNHSGEARSCLLSVSFQDDSHPHRLIHGIIHD